MNSLLDPSVSVLVLFAHEQVPLAEANRLWAAWTADGRLALVSESPDHRCFQGAVADGVDCRLDWGLAHDTHLLRLTLSQPGALSAAAWGQLSAELASLTSDAWGRRHLPTPWAGTYLYSATLPAGTGKEDAAALVADGAGLGATASEARGCDVTPFGWLWSLQAVGRPGQGGQDPYYRRLALLAPQDRAEQVRAFFVEPLTQGLARIELYLHKGLHHTSQHEVVRRELVQAGDEMQAGMLAALRTDEDLQLHRERRELDAIARKLTRFQVQRAQAGILLNSLRSNLGAFTEHLERVSLDSGCYAHEAARLERQIEQLESDLRNANTLAESTYAFQDVQRGVEAARMARSSFLLGGAAVLLAAVTIFSSFLDIWTLAVEGSAFALPPPWLRIVLGLLAAVGWPLGAYWAIERRKVPAAVALGVGLLAVALAVVATVLWSGGP